MRQTVRRAKALFQIMVNGVHQKFEICKWQPLEQGVNHHSSLAVVPLLVQVRHLLDLLAEERVIVGGARVFHRADAGRVGWVEGCQVFKVWR